MAKILNVKTGKGKIGWYPFKLSRRGMDDIYFARVTPFSVIKADEIARWCSEFAQVSEANMTTAFSALAKAIQYFVLNGHSVTLSGLGCFTFTTKAGVYNNVTGEWESAGHDDIDDCLASDIRGTYVRFRPGTELREKIGSAKFVNILGTNFGQNKINGQTLGESQGENPSPEPTPDPTPSAPAAPTINIGATGQVRISGASGAALYYTTDGSTPTTASSLYSQPFDVADGTTVKAIAVKDGLSSTVASATYNAEPAPQPGTEVATPVISDDANITANGTVHVTCATQGAQMYYTVGMDSDPADPTTASTPVPANGTIVANESYSEDAHLKVIAYLGGVYSSVASKTVPARQDD